MKFAEAETQLAWGKMLAVRGGHERSTGHDCFSTGWRYGDQPKGMPGSSANDGHTRESGLKHSKGRRYSRLARTESGSWSRG